MDDVAKKYRELKEKKVNFLSAPYEIGTGNAVEFEDPFGNRFGFTSISRISSLSFYMDLFFSGRINQILSKFKFYRDTRGHDELFRKIEIKFDDESVETLYRPIGLLPDEFEKLGSSTIHINYSGGDDLLVVGPYDDKDIGDCGYYYFLQRFFQFFKKTYSR